MKVIQCFESGPRRGVNVCVVCGVWCVVYVCVSVGGGLGGLRLERSCNMFRPQDANAKPAAVLYGPSAPLLDEPGSPMCMLALALIGPDYN